MEWFRVDDAARGQIRAVGAAAIQPAVPLESAAKKLVEQRITNPKEYERLFNR